MKGKRKDVDLVKQVQSEDSGKEGAAANQLL